MKSWIFIRNLRSNKQLNVSWKVWIFIRRDFEILTTWGMQLNLSYVLIGRFRLVPHTIKSQNNLRFLQSYSLLAIGSKNFHLRSRCCSRPLVTLLGLERDKLGDRERMRVSFWQAKTSQPCACCPLPVWWDTARGEAGEISLTIRERGYRLHIRVGLVAQATYVGGWTPLG